LWRGLTVASDEAGKPLVWRTRLEAERLAEQLGAGWRVGSLDLGHARPIAFYVEQA
jgi:hypothetical protein